MNTAYGIAFKGNRFLMVYNPKRNGWEMPGGHVEDGESVRSAVSREFVEECGYSVDIVNMMDLEHCHVCACIIKEMKNENAEMRHMFFDELPADLAFAREEYEFTIPWARKAVLDPAKTVL